MGNDRYLLEVYVFLQVVFRETKSSEYVVSENAFHEGLNSLLTMLLNASQPHLLQPLIEHTIFAIASNLSYLDG